MLIGIIHRKSARKVGRELMLKVTKERRILWIRFDGKIDSRTENELEQLVAWELDDVEELWIDMAGVEDVSSVMLRILSYAKSELSERGHFHILHMGDKIKKKIVAADF